MCCRAQKHYNTFKLSACVLTRSSSDVRLGVRVGACGTLGSLPRLGGSGSRGNPLHMSFKEDILSHTHLVIVLSGEKALKIHSSLYCLTGRLCPFTIHQWCNTDEKKKSVW